jgi:hypothetical protein
MKLCQSCWDKLRIAIEQRGLGGFISKDGEVAASQIVNQLTAGVSVDNYDPLMAANFAIWSQSLQSFGIGMMSEDAPCPLCYRTELEAHCVDPKCSKQTGDDWIQFAADDQLAAAIEKGLVSQAN